MPKGKHMSVEKAKTYYTNADKNSKLNCCQAVVAAFAEKFSVGADTIAQFSAYGGGKAPGGLCGAYYAARFILERKQGDKADQCESEFLSKAGATTCKEIRRLKRLTCLGCVQAAAECIESLVE